MPPIRTRDHLFPSMHSVLRQADSLPNSTTIYYQHIPLPSFVFRYEPYGHAYFDRNHPLMTATHDGDIDWDDRVYFTVALVSDLVLAAPADSHHRDGFSPRRKRSPSWSPSLLAVRLGAFLFFSYSCCHSLSAPYSFGLGTTLISETSYKNPVGAARHCHKFSSPSQPSVLPHPS
ncbi:hypothetical protein ARMSODRAFT_717164 [Armillaria solidipes]|uniref:Uncharacterized protein n=1 Tax=Armillaria solidipes TaxID=1076256 RepID=A0A2H3C1P6_9AGAR|nr:hypothetical protein ARMSODRAFT_717164 [Armillaria solidipes]